MTECWRVGMGVVPSAARCSAEESPNAKVLALLLLAKPDLIHLDAAVAAASFNYELRANFELNEPFRHWSPVDNVPKVAKLRDALNRIVHATKFTVGFERLPEQASKISGGAIGVIYLRTRTDQRDEALVDVFALASCFFNQVRSNVRHSLGSAELRQP